MAIAVAAASAAASAAATTTSLASLSSNLSASLCFPKSVVHVTDTYCKPGYFLPSVVCSLGVLEFRLSPRPWQLTRRLSGQDDFGGFGVSFLTTVARSYQVPRMEGQDRGTSEKDCPVNGRKSRIRILFLDIL